MIDYYHRILSFYIFTILELYDYLSKYCVIFRFILHGIFSLLFFSRPLFLSNRAKIPRETESSQRTRPLASTHPFLTIHFLRNNLPHGSVILYFRPLCTRVKIRILRCADVFLHMKLCAGAKIKLSQIQKKETKIFQNFLVFWCWKSSLYKCYSLSVITTSRVESLSCFLLISAHLSFVPF